MSADAPFVSVVIPALDAAATVGRVLESLLAQVHEEPPPPPFEIIVADDGSTDGTVAVVHAFGSAVRVVEGDHTGPGGARNRGAAAASGEVLAFVDADDLPLPGWVRQLGVPFADPGVGLVSWPALVHTPDHERSEVWRKRPGGPDGFLPLTGCFAVRTAVFRAVGGYDPVLRMAENSDLCARLRMRCDEQGLRVESCPDVTVEIWRAKELEHYDRRRLDAVEHLLARDAGTPRSSPARRARLHSIATVNAARCGEWARARRHAVAALRARPGDPRAYARLVGATVPPLGRALWVAEGRRREASRRRLGREP